MINLTYSESLDYAALTSGPFSPLVPLISAQWSKNQKKFRKFFENSTFFNEKYFRIKYFCINVTFTDFQMHWNIKTSRLHIAAGEVNRPFSAKNWNNSKCPIFAAKWSGVQLSSLHLGFLFTILSLKYLHRSKSPLSAAICNGDQVAQSKASSKVPLISADCLPLHIYCGF